MSGSTSQVPPITVMLLAEAATIPPDTLGTFGGQFTSAGGVGIDSVSAGGGALPSLTVAASTTQQAGTSDVPSEAYASATVTQSFEVLGPSGPVAVDFVADLSVAETNRVQPGVEDSQVFAGVVAPDGTRSFVELASNSFEDSPTPVLAIRQTEFIQTGKVYNFQVFGDAEATYSATTQGSASATVVLDPATSQDACSIVFGADPPCYVAGNRASFANGALASLAADFGHGGGCAQACAPLATGGPVVEALRARLGEASAGRGQAAA